MRSGTIILSAFCVLSGCTAARYNVAPTPAPQTQSVVVYLYEADRLDEAEALALKQHKSGRHDANVHLVLGKIYWQRGQNAEMVQQLEVYVKEAPPGPLREQAQEVLGVR